MTLEERFINIVESFGGFEHDEGDVLLNAMREEQIEIVDVSDPDHYIEFRDDHWLIVHPMGERLTGSLLDCTAMWDGMDPGMRGLYKLIHEDEYDNWTLGEKMP